MTEQSLTAQEQRVQRCDLRRAERAEALRVLWRESGSERQRNCGKAIAPGNSQGVGVRVSEGASGRVAGFSGLERCGLVWTCPECSAKIAATRQGELEQAIRAWQARAGCLLHVTVTMRHDIGQDLKTLWDALAEAWKRATGGAGWKQDQETWGGLLPRQIKSGKRKGETVHSKRIPIVRYVEGTDGDNGWHMHVHALLFLPHLVSDATADEIGGRLFERWAAALQGAGLAAPLRDSGGLHVRVVAEENAAETFGDYYTKATYVGPGTAALEMARGDLKDARHGNRTPFAILRDVYQNGDARSLARWHEWERGSKNRRQIAWSPGLRELLAVEPEATDQEIVDEDLGGAHVLFIEPESWSRVVCVVPGLRALILWTTIHAEGSLRHLLDEYRVSWHEPDPPFVT